MSRKRKQGFSILLGLIFVASLFVFIKYIEEGKITRDLFSNWRNPHCNIPMKIELGNIDPRFNLSKETILEELEKASSVWEKAEGKDMFVFDGNNKNKVLVNFIYDNRQEEVTESEGTKLELEKGWAQYEKMVDDANQLESSYLTLKNKYERDESVYEGRLKDLETKTNAWNAHPGNEAEFNALKKEEAAVKNLYASLETERVTLNKTADKLNAANGPIQDLYSSLSQKTDEFNKKYSSGDEITVGEFDGTYNLNVYQYTTLDQLLVTLTHELGHSLGMEHTTNSESIMFPIQGGQDTKNLTPTPEDLAELSRVCDNTNNNSFVVKIFQDIVNI